MGFNLRSYGVVIPQMTPTVESAYYGVGLPGTIQRESTRTKKCCLILAIKMQGTYRSGEGGEEATIHMTPDLSYDYYCM